MTNRPDISSLLSRPTEETAPEPSRRRLSAIGMAAPKPAELQPGDVLQERYALVSPLGEGGMGDVWLAHNTTLDVKVALKVLRVDDNQPERRAKLTQRLLTEARAAAKLDHPAIVRIIDFGETPSGNGFVVMELLEGEDLHSLLARHGRLSATKSVRTLLPIAGALVTAHAKAIVHRDLKPENIFLSRNDEQGTVQPKLIDFGVAKLKPVNERLTIAGTVMGSPGYMAPEQARGEDVDERADVWGFSVVLYETVTGRLPFEGKNYNALMRSIIEDQPAPTTTFGVGDDVLWEIIERGLYKDPDKRWQSMRELGAALARWLLQRRITEDICGVPLAATWVRDRTHASYTSGSPPEARDSTPSRESVEARRRRAELATEPPPALEVGSEQASEAPPSKRSRRAVGIVALSLGALAGVAFGAWAVGQSSAAPQPGTTSALPAPSASPTPSPRAPETAHEQAIHLAPTSASVAAPAAAAPRRGAAAAPATAKAGPSSAPKTSVLKNPY